MTSFAKLTPPKAKKMPRLATHHGIERDDPYSWMRADNWQEVMHDTSVLDAEIRSHLEAENTYMNAYFDGTESFQDTLFEELKGRIKQDDSSVPAPYGDYAYATRFVEGGQYPIFVRTPRGDGEEQVLLDGNLEGKDKEYFSLSGLSTATNHNIAVWGVDDAGSEYYTLRLRDLTTGKDLPDIIEKTGGSCVWAADCASFFYVELDDNHRPSKVMRHIVGTPVHDDTIIYEEADAGFFVGLDITASDKFILISCHDHQTSECHIIPADAPDTAPRIIQPRENEIEYDLDQLDENTFLILTNADGAEDKKLMIAPIDTPSREHWVDYVPHEEGRMIKYFQIFKDYLIWLETRDALPRIIVQSLSDKQEHVISFDEEAYSLGAGGTLEYDSQIMRFSYSSMTTPSRTYDYNMRTRERVLLKEQEIPSGHEIDDYVTQRVFAPSHDGTPVPVTLLYRKDTPLDGSAPCLLYGYGSYGMSMPASFSTARLSLVNRGFVYAIAHIRGGMEKGHAWYKAGKRDHKPNTFQDFIAAGLYLDSNNFTSKGRIVAEGGSAGGMLMGAVANMRPDLFGGIIAAVPFVDVLSTMLDNTLPLTPPEWPEWGNPIESEADYKSIASYSPIDNVSAQVYPPIFAIGGLTDPRVTYWEPAKWVATLREKAHGDSPLLLKTNMGAGHGGASGRFDRLKEVAQEYVFALKVTGFELMFEKT